MVYKTDTDEFVSESHLKDYLGTLDEPNKKSLAADERIIKGILTVAMNDRQKADEQINDALKSNPESGLLWSCKLYVSVLNNGYNGFYDCPVVKASQSSEVDIESDRIYHLRDDDEYDVLSVDEIGGISEQSLCSVIKTIESLDNPGNNWLFFADILTDHKNNLGGDGLENDVIIAYNTSVYLNPGQINALYKRLEFKITMGRWTDALDDVNELLTRAGHDVTFVSIKSEILIKLGYYNDAIKHLDLLISNYPGNYDLYRNKALVYLFMGDHLQDAREMIDRALELEISDSLVWAAKGDIELESGNLVGAYESFSKAIEIDPESINVILTMIEVCINLEAPDEAIDLCNRAERLADNQEMVTVNYLRSVAYTSKGRIKEAFSDINRSLELYPDYKRALVHKGVLYCLMGKYEEANSIFDEAVKMGVESNYMYYYYSSAMVKAGHYDKGIELIDRYLETDPNNLEKNLEKANVLGIMLMMKDDALQILDSLIDIYGENLGIIETKVNILVEHDEVNKAEELIEKMINEGDTKKYLMAQVHKAKNDFKSAIRCYDEMSYQGYGVVLEKGMVYLTTSHYEMALECFNEALQIEPNSLNVLELKVSALVNLGRFDDALGPVNEVLENNPDHLEMRSVRVMASIITGQTDGLAEDIEALDKNLDEDTKSQIFNEYTKLLEMRPMSMDSQYLKALIYSKL